MTESPPTLGKGRGGLVSGQQGSLPERVRHWDQLALREKQIVSLIASGKQNKQIASDLGVTTGTNKVHVNHILKKVEARSRTALALPQQGSLPERVRHWDQLTHREKQIVSLIALGKQNKHIASDLGVTTGTIKVHVNHILKKVEARNRMALAVLYLSL